MASDFAGGQLIERAVTGNRDAMTALLWNHYDRLSSHIGAQVPNDLKGRVDVEDILQDTFTTAWQKIDTLRQRDPDSFYYWIKTIAQHKLLDTLRAGRRVKRGGDALTMPMSNDSSSSLAPLLDMIADDEGTPSSVVAGHEAEAELRLALTELSENYRTVLSLRYLEGLPVSAVATRMRCTEGAIHMLANRAIKKLRQTMGSASNYF